MMTCAIVYVVVAFASMVYFVWDSVECSPSVVDNKGEGMNRMACCGLMALLWPVLACYMVLVAVGACKEEPTVGENPDSLFKADCPICGSLLDVREVQVAGVWCLKRDTCDCNTPRGSEKFAYLDERYINGADGKEDEK